MSTLFTSPAQAARLVLVGALGAMMLRGLWAMPRRKDDLAARIVGLACCLVGLALLAKVVRNVALSPGSIVIAMKVEYSIALGLVPATLALLAKRARWSSFGIALVAVAAIPSALVWVDGVLFHPEITWHPSALDGRFPSLAPAFGQALLPAFLLGGGAASAFWARRADVLLEREARTLVWTGALVLAPGAALDVLMDAGVLPALPAVEVAAAVTVAVAALVFMRRAHLAYGDAAETIGRQTEALRQTRNEQMAAERHASLGALSAGIGHEIINPLAAVTVNVEVALGLVHRLRDLPTLPPSWENDLADAAGCCREIARAVADLQRESEIPGGPTSSSHGSVYAAEPGPVAPARVLVVDDEPVVARALARTLRGHDVVVASGGSEALALARERAFDVVLCDVMMPGMTGIDVWEHLHREGLAAADRFAFVTGGVFAPDVARAVAASGIRVLRKPVSLTDLEPLFGAVGSRDRADAGGKESV